MKEMKRMTPNAIARTMLLVLLGSLTLVMGFQSGAEEATKPRIIVGGAPGGSGTAPLYTENNIQVAPLNMAGLSREDWTEEKLYDHFKRCHAIVLQPASEGIFKLDDKLRNRAAAAGKALARYVQEGGGLFVKPMPVRYPGSDDEKYWNLVLAPFGMEVLHEGVYDRTRTFQGATLESATFWFTRNIQPHPVTEGVSGLCLPLHGMGPAPGLVAMKYSPEWQVLVRGEKEAKSYRCGEDNNLDISVDGTYSNEPPVLAVRSFGKGRVACYPLCNIFTGCNYGNPLWAHIVETKGDPSGKCPSQSMRLQMNAYRWLGETATAIPEFGTYRPAPYKPAALPPKVEWTAPTLALTPEQIAAVKEVRGIVGAHSTYSDGKGTVSQYAQAAKAAGVSVLVFADPLEKLTPETLEKLKADCAEVSKAGDFYACPGIEFTDGIGNRWAFWGEKVVFPDASFMDKNNTFVQWDGKRVNHYGQFANMCQHPGSALLDYNQLRANGAHPENLWWFFHYFPLVYDHGKLSADNFNDYLFGLRDMRWAAVSSFTRITDPAELAQAAGLCFTGFNSLPAAKTALNTRCGAWGIARNAGQYVSQGPVIAAWAGVNSQRASDVKCTSGAQRVRLYFAVRSDKGIAEVRVHDADRGLVRRFLGHGEKQLAREFELVHDRQRCPTLEVIDTTGNRAFSTYVWIFCYKTQLFRCSDNLNILGGTAMCWHPDRNEFFNAAKDFRNGADFRLHGWDTASLTLGVPAPHSWLGDMIHIKEAGIHTGEYPHPWTLNACSGRMMDMGVNGSDLQIATMRMTTLSELCDTKQRPGPAIANIAKDLGDIEFYERTHTLYAPMERVNMFVAWDLRQEKESRRDYRGAILWHEGEYRFKKDVTLKYPGGIDLYNERHSVNLGKNIATTLLVSDAERGLRTGFVRSSKESVRLQGRLQPGGYAAWLPYPIGYRAFLAPSETTFYYDANLSNPGSLAIGMGEPGLIKAGTVMSYRFGVATVADTRSDSNDLLEHMVKAMNLGGGHDGYPVEMKVGELKDAVFFFTAAAKDGEALFTLGPQSLLIDLPIRVQGIEDNGCAAIHSTKLPRFRFIPVDEKGTGWLTEPIDQKNEMWIGNVFLSDNKNIKLTLVVDGQAEGQKPFIEVHNPTDAEIETTLSSPGNTPVFGGMSGKFRIPPGDSIHLVMDGKQILEFGGTIFPAKQKFQHSDEIRNSSVETRN